jgi:hypothetical protein
LLIFDTIYLLENNWRRCHPPWKKPVASATIAPGADLLFFI